jgi:hypothetical protein
MHRLHGQPGAIDCHLCMLLRWLRNMARPGFRSVPLAT